MAPPSGSSAINAPARILRERFIRLWSSKVDPGTAANR
jgi:hypothetical protein